MLRGDLHNHHIPRQQLATIAEMTPEELRALIESIIEEKLLELLGEPDEG